MKKTLFSATCAATFLASTAFAAPIGAFSELVMTHGFVINSGNVPTGLEIDAPSSTYEFETDATSTVDDASAIPSQTNFVQVGNQFADPVLPFISQRNDSSQLPGGFEGAAGQYDVQVTMQDDPTSGVNGIIRRDVEQEGGASTILLDDTIEASATSYVRHSRDLVFTNTTNETLSFNIAGQFNAMLRAEYNGDNGIARVAGGFELEFSELAGGTITYFSIAPYLLEIDDIADTATVSEQLFVNENGVTGLQFNASATAIGNGGTTLASFEGEHRYIFGVSLDPFASVRLGTSYTQANSVEHTPQPDIAPVPLPASAVFLMLGLGLLAAQRPRFRAG